MEDDAEDMAKKIPNLGYYSSCIWPRFSKYRKDLSKWEKVTWICLFVQVLLIISGVLELYYHDYTWGWFMVIANFIFGGLNVFNLKTLNNTRKLRKLTEDYRRELAQ